MTWSILGVRSLFNENGNIFGYVFCLKYGNNYPIEALFLGDFLPVVCDDFMSLPSCYTVKWSVKKHKWYIFYNSGVDDEV